MEFSLCAPHPVTVVLKLAVDQSGGVDERSALKSERFTSSESLDAAHRLRRDLDAVLVGVETVVRDNPSLTVRRVELQKDTQPLRVVLDRTLRIPRKCALLTDNKAKTVIMYSTMCTMESRVRDLEDEIRGTGVTLMGIGSLTDSGSMPPLLILDQLQSWGVRSVLLEGGPFTAQTFLAEGPLLFELLCVFHPPGQVASIQRLSGPPGWNIKVLCIWA
eukprot:368046_1